MAVWWCAIDRGHTSYDELKQRGAVAQGWRRLGDLSKLTRFVPGDFEIFAEQIRSLGDTAYADLPLWQKDRDPRRAPRVLWNLLNLQTGDLVVGVEGTIVRGICQLPANGVDLYRYQPEWEYGQALQGVAWVDWELARLGPPPVAPAQGLHGIKALRKDEPAVAAAWEKQTTPCD